MLKNGVEIIIYKATKYLLIEENMSKEVLIFGILLMIGGLIQWHYGGGILDEENKKIKDLFGNKHGEKASKIYFWPSIDFRKESYKITAAIAIFIGAVLTIIYIIYSLYICIKFYI